MGRGGGSLVSIVRSPGKRSRACLVSSAGHAAGSGLLVCLLLVAGCSSLVARRSSLVARRSSLVARRSSLVARRSSLA